MGVFKSRHIGKYQLQAELGRGGFGSVYRAYDPTVGRLVAIKVLTASGDQQLLNRFKNEAAAAGNLRHKNILTIYDFGEHEGLPYIVMEFLEGEDLQQVITQNRPLPLLEKVSIMLQVADGLHCAHRSGVVHRDVKPGNIRLLPDGTVKIMDFGIARVMAGSAGSARLTRQGHVIGTLLYMAPEQVRGGEVDFLCDIFAYGITYYELLTGRHPFQGSDPRTVFYRITSEDPEPIRNIVPECPEALEAIVNRALHKERELRYQSLREVQLDSEPLLIELRQERAATLLAEATRLYDSAQLDSAQAVLSEAFDLDPGNRGARQLRETIQQQLLRRVIEPKVKALLDKGDALVKERRFSDAIEVFESALRLDRENAAISQRLSRARELLTVSRETARVVADARREFSRNNVDAALQTLPEALDQDPGNPEARQLLEDVRKELARREKARQDDLRLREARDLSAAGSFDEALRLLDGLDSDERLGEEVRNLATEIRTRKQEQQRRQKFQEELAVAREMMATGQQEKVIRRLERLMAAYPEEPEATKLFILAHKKLAAQRKGEALERLGNELAALLEVHRYDRAIELVNDALRDYPAEQRLTDALHDIEARQEEHQRAEAIREALQSAQSQVAAGNPESAEAILTAALALHPNDPQLTDALRDARSALEQKRRTEAIDRACSDAASAMGRADFAQALAAIDQGIQELGADPRLVDARVSVVTAQAARERERAIQEALAKSDRSLSAGDPGDAVRVLEAAARLYPDAEALAGALAESRRSLEEHERERTIAAATSDARGAAERHDYAGAISSLEAALARYPDDRIRELRREVVEARQAWERAEGIRAALEQSGQALRRDDPDSAAVVIQSALASYGDDPRLADALAEATVESACRTARAHLAGRRFDDALVGLDAAIGSFPEDLRLGGLRQEAANAKADWERAESIRRAVDEADDRSAAQDLPAALRIVEEALAAHPGESTLTAKAAEFREAIERQRREDTVQRAIRDASEARGAHDFGRALAILAEAATTCADDRRLAQLREEVRQAQAAWEQSEAVEAATQSANDRLAAGDSESAVRVLETALRAYPTDSRLRDTLAAARREHAITYACQQATAHLGSREFDRALDTVGQALSEAGRDPRLEALKSRIVADRIAWHRAETVRTALDVAAKRLAEHDPNGAVEALETAESRYPGEPAIETALAEARRALAGQRRDEAIASACREANRSLELGDWQRASSVAAACVEEHGEDARLAEVCDRVARAKAEQEQNDSVGAALSGASRLTAGGDPDRAMHVLDSSLERYPDDERLLSARAQAAALAEEKRRNDAIDAVDAAVHELAGRGEFPRALEEIEHAAAQHGADPRLAQLREETIRARADREREDEIRRVLEASRSADGPEAAVALLKASLAKYPGESRLEEALRAANLAIEAKARNAAVQRVSKQVRQLTKRRDFDAALGAVEDALSTYPDEDRLVALKEQVVGARKDWEREQTVRRALSEAAGLHAENHFAEALQVLKTALERYPSDPRLLTAHSEIEADQRRQQNREAFEATLQDALARLEQEPEVAVRTLEALQEDNPDDSRIPPALDRGRQLLADRMRETTVAAVCQETRVYLQDGDFDGALQTVERGLDTLGDEESLAQMRETVLASKADWERAQGIRHAVDEADHLAKTGQLETAVETLISATRVWGPEDRLTQAIAVTREAIEEKAQQDRIAGIRRQAEAALDAHDLDEASRVLDTGEAAEGAAPAFGALRERIIAERDRMERLEAGRRALAEGNRLLENGEADQALTLLEGATHRYPEVGGLVEARSRAAEAVKTKRAQLALDAICREIEAELAAANFKAAEKKLAAARKKHGTQSRWDDLQAAIERATAARKVEARPVAVTEPVAVRQRRITPLAAAAVVGVLAVGALLKLTVFGGGDSGVVEVQASPATAVVKVGDRTCSASDCRFELKPGAYRIEVSADGYEAKTEEASVARGGSKQVSVALRAIPATLQVSANFADGQVAINGRDGQLQDGQFAVSAMETGPHQVRVSGKEGAATLSFQSEAAKLPTLNSITADGVEAVALSTFGKQLAISCAGCSGTVWIDDKAAGEMKSGGLHVDALTPGAHRLRLTGNSGDRNLVLTAGGAPAVSLTLTSNKNYGTLVVETGEDGASVWIDGRRNDGRTVRGQLRINVDAGPHTVRVAKDGYRVEPGESRAVVARGDQFQARFRLVSLPAKLLITGATPGATVRIDGSSRGTVIADGSFTSDVTQGQHRVELTKDGFATASASVAPGPGGVVRLGKQQLALTPLAASSTAARSAPPEEAKAPVAAPPPAPDPAALEAAEWRRVSQSPASASVEEFLRKYPTGANAAEARRVLERLDWSATNKNSRDSLQAFLGKHPGGTFASQASGELSRLDRESAAQVKQQQDAERLRAERDQIRAVLRSYSEAYAQKDPKQIAALWPSMPARDVRDIKASFRDFQSLKVDLQPLAEPEVAGGSARVSCRRTTVAVDRNGPHSTDGTVTVHFQKRDGRWIIDSIQ